MQMQYNIALRATAAALILRSEIMRRISALTYAFASRLTQLVRWSHVPHAPAVRSRRSGLAGGTVQRFERQR